MKQRFNPLQDISAHATLPPVPPAGSSPTRTSPRKTKPKSKKRARAAIDPQQALQRARGSLSHANIPIIIAAFTARGIPADQIKPRENVLTFDAWKALGRCVRKGEKSVHLPVIIMRGGDEKFDAATGQTIVTPVRKIHWTAHVFHISQTDPLDQPTQQLQSLTKTFAAAPAICVSDPSSHRPHKIGSWLTKVGMRAQAEH